GLSSLATRRTLWISWPWTSSKHWSKTIKSSEVCMRSIRYGVAMSLDGYIAGPKGEADWIIMDPEIDFAAMWAEFDTLLIGRKTFEDKGGAKSGTMPGMKYFVFSRTLRQSDYPQVTIMAKDPREMLNSLKAEPGKDIWLFGGGSLFRSLLDAG